MQYPSIFEIGKAVHTVDLSFVSPEIRTFEGKVLSGFLPEGTPILDGQINTSEWSFRGVCAMLNMLSMHPAVNIEVCNEHVAKDFYATTSAVHVVGMMREGCSIADIGQYCDAPEWCDETFDFPDGCLISPLSLYINGSHVWTAPLVLGEDDMERRAKAAVDALYAAVPAKVANAVIGVERFANGMMVVSGKEADMLLDKIHTESIIKAAKDSGDCFVADDEEGALRILSAAEYPDGTAEASIYKEECLNVFNYLVQKEGYDFVYELLAPHHYMNLNAHQQNLEI